MSPSPPRYEGRCRWVAGPDGTVTLTFDPPLTIPARHRLDLLTPLPPALGGPEGWTPVACDFVPLPPEDVR